MAKPYKEDKKLVERNQVAFRLKIKVTKLKRKTGGNGKANGPVQGWVTQAVWGSRRQEERTVNMPQDHKVTKHGTGNTQGGK